MERKVKGERKWEIACDKENEDKRVGGRELTAKENGRHCRWKNEESKE